MLFCHVLVTVVLYSMALQIQVLIGLIRCKIEGYELSHLKNKSVNLMLRDFLKFQALVLILKCINDSLPPYFNKYVSYRSYRNPYTVRSKLDLKKYYTCKGVSRI